MKRHPVFEHATPVADPRGSFEDADRADTETQSVMARKHERRAMLPNRYTPSDGPLLLPRDIRLEGCRDTTFFLCDFIDGHPGSCAGDGRGPCGRSFLQDPPCCISSVELDRILCWSPRRIWLERCEGFGRPRRDLGSRGWPMADRQWQPRPSNIRCAGRPAS